MPQVNFIDHLPESGCSADLTYKSDSPDKAPFTRFQLLYNIDFISIPFARYGAMTRTSSQLPS